MKEDEAQDYQPASPHFSTDGKRLVILRVFVSSWWVGRRLYHEGAKTRRIARNAPSTRIGSSSVRLSDWTVCRRLPDHSGWRWWRRRKRCPACNSRTRPG